ncbi:hypothetical protein EJ05DRAFT_197826 [Pseudovirgaria hyperparasitica]|uniref:Protein transport protein SEC31 n=1 Tax=Pseudovirgaria hyperparasitica TaxID=470096 RepID=A0A6A6WH39_9PEZI|nr:uncharacterized protein EJ05DRAFT_197826 [Pseudovirgaria hyperparasitica]KAF2762123.1 hypothetical protein EJ05DRAFT_197826 [Pseudovirgaria hyperparasitica]
MVRLREIPRTATFAWSPGAQAPLIATGTRAGAVDADFSNETVLELWELALDNVAQGAEITPIASISADSRFHDIAWSQPTNDHPRGIIAGALENGSLDLWDAEKLLKNASDSHITRIDKHTGPIKALQFNPFRPELLATGGAKGELYITDVTNPSSSFRLGSSAARADDIEAIDWNKKVPHILATGSSGGFVTVWNVKEKKENLTLNNYGRKAVSAVAWDPNVPTRLITAVPNDMDPLILMWDLRNSNAPEKILKAHEQGVLSLDWCRHDSDLLLSCGKDNKTICWNPHTGQALGEFPIVTNWTFQTRFNPHNPGLIATASFDGRIAVQTIQSTRKDDKATTTTSQSLSGEDFFASAQTLPQGDTFSLPQAPKWLRRPVGVSFGFGGKLVKLSTTELGSSQSKITISTFAADAAVGIATERFEKTLEEGDLAKICEDKISTARTDEEKADWTVIETLITGNARKKLVDYLGFADAAVAPEESQVEVNGKAEDKDGSAFFDGGDVDSFLSDLAATKGARTNNPFNLYSGQESEADKRITQYLILGNFDRALDVCLQEDRMSDAFMIAICGGQECIARAQAAYFKGKAQGPNYLRLLASVVGKNLWDTVHNANLDNWKEVMATVCTFADASEFPDLCEALGDRLEEAYADAADRKSLRRDASFCYLAGSKLEKVVTNWVQELQENENAGLEEAEQETSFFVHAKSLQDFIEKVTIFRKVTGFRDEQLNQAEDWKLAALYAKYTEYADVVAAHGQLHVAEKYLDLLPAKYPAADVARNRVKQATTKATPTVQNQPAPAVTQAQRGQRVVPSYAQTQPAPAPTQSVPSPYAPVQQQTVSAYASQAQQATNPYPPAPGARSYTPNAYAPATAPGIPQPSYGGYQAPQQQSIPPPPRGFTSSPSVVPAAQRKDIAQWNDTPDFGPKIPPPRRNTPTVQGPFGNQQTTGPPPMMSPTGFQQSRPTPPPPPKGPLGGAGPPPSAPQTFQPPPRPSSSAANAYAPPTQSPNQTGFAPPVQAPPRGPSPYNPPPSTAAPSSNRYAPAPGSQPTPPPGGLPTPRATGPPPQNYYGAAPSQYAPQPGPGPASAQAPPPSGPPRGPPQGPPRAAPPPGPPQRPPSGPPQAVPTPPPAAAKYPPGDRSHIPPPAQPIFEILSGDMQRVKSKAPASFKPQVLDTEKRLNILFDHLNNEDVVKPGTVQQMGELAQALQGRNYEQATAIITDIIKVKNDEGSNWMVGVQRLLKMSRATPL